MGFQAKVGSLAQPAVTGNASVTGLPFAPKAVIFFGNKMTADGAAADAANFIGFAGLGADGSTITHKTHGSEAGDALATSQASIWGSSTQSIQHYTRANVNGLTATVTSFNSDGFTMNVTTTDGVARIINYIAIGGSDVVGAASGSYQTNGVSGSVNPLHGFGFRPDFIIGSQERGNTAGPPYNSAAFNSAERGFGAMDLRGVVTQSSLAYYYAHATTSAYTHKSYQRADKFYVRLTTALVFKQGTLDTVDAANLGTTNEAFSTATITNLSLMALKGATAKVGSFLQPASTGAQNVDVGFKPAFVILMSGNKAAETTATQSIETRVSFGAFDNQLNQSCIWHGGVSGGESSVTKCQSALSRTRAFKSYNAGGANPTLTGEAEVTALSNSGFTLNWSTCDGVQREILYLAVAAPRQSHSPLLLHD